MGDLLSMSGNPQVWGSAAGPSFDGTVKREEWVSKAFSLKEGALGTGVQDAERRQGHL